MWSSTPNFTVFSLYVASLILIVSHVSAHQPMPPPRLNPFRPDLSYRDLKLGRSSKEVLTDNSTDVDDDIPPHMLSINEGASIDLVVKSSSSITVNLNRPVDEEVVVSVTVLSGPNLINFVDKKQDTLKSNLSEFRNYLAYSSNQVELKFPANFFGDLIVNLETKEEPGHAIIVCKVKNQPKSVVIDDSSAYISVNIALKSYISATIGIVGWIYFAAWSLSFYFQVILNYQRKSCVGLNFDFLALNLLGFVCYTVYNFSMMFSSEVQKKYYERHAYSRIPVEYNDLFFAVHAVVLTLVNVIQCFIYERGDQRVSLWAKGYIVLALIGAGALYIANLFSAVASLDVIVFLSMVKLVITLIKYIPQAYMNYSRKATTGWSIHNILLDFTGGTFSIAQMFLLAYNFGDWISIFGNFTKFGLGIISISFDVIFLVQHYVLYSRQTTLEVSTESIPEPVINESINSTTSRHYQAQDDTSSDSN